MDTVLYMVVAILVMAGLWQIFGGIAKAIVYGVGEIKSLLKCTTDVAKKVKETLDREGVTFMQFHRYVENALGHFLPVFAVPGQGQIIATWKETRRAATAIVLKGQYTRRMTMDEFFAKVAREIAIQRGELLPRSFRVRSTGLGLGVSEDPATAPEDRINF